MPFRKAEDIHYRHFLHYQLFWIQTSLPPRTGGILTIFRTEKGGMKVLIQKLSIHVLLFSR